MVLNVAVLGLSVLAAHEVEAAGNSTSPPVAADKTNDGL
jgi:hypothetical protein